uniref:Putative secreted protein n=1 Tax=Ixodes ricinus TaxID=34613 RepID=A0A6B0UHJ7_IXORI
MAQLVFGVLLEHLVAGACSRREVQGLPRPGTRTALVVPQCQEPLHRPDGRRVVHHVQRLCVHHQAVVCTGPEWIPLVRQLKQGCRGAVCFGPEGKWNAENGT